MEIVSEERQRRRYRDGINNAAQMFRLDAEQAEALGLEEGRRVSKRILGLLTSGKSWSATIEEAHDQNNYREAMSEVTQPFTPEGATEPTTMYEQGLLKTPQEDWINAIVNRGIDKFNAAMTEEHAYASYRGAAPQIADWLESITMPHKSRTNDFDPEDQLSANMDRCRAVALGMNRQSMGRDLPGASTGNPVPVQAPAPAAMSTTYEVAFEEMNGVQEYANVFDPDVRLQPPPDWHGKSLAKADAFAALHGDEPLLARAWYNSTSAVAEDDFLGAATGPVAMTNYSAAMAGGGQDLIVDKYMDAYAPYREALTQVPLDEQAPRGPTGSDANMDRVELVASAMINQKYVGYQLAGSGAFTPAGTGIWGEFADVLTDWLDIWGF